MYPSRIDASSLASGLGRPRRLSPRRILSPESWLRYVCADKGEELPDGVVLSHLPLLWPRPAYSKHRLHTASTGTPTWLNHTVARHHATLLDLARGIMGQPSSRVEELRDHAEGWDRQTNHARYVNQSRLFCECIAWQAYWCLCMAGLHDVFAEACSRPKSTRQASPILSGPTWKDDIQWGIHMLRIV